MRKMRLIYLTFLLVFMAVSLFGCGTETEQGQDKTPIEETKDQGDNNEQEVEEPEHTNSSFPVTITDDTGEEVVIETEPERIVTLVPSATEIVFGLGLGDKVVGVTDNDNYPEEVKNIEKVGAFKLNIEKIVSLEPDLVVADVVNGKVVGELRELGLTVLVLGASNLEETYEDILTAGKATGTVVDAQKVVNEMKEQQAEIERVISEIPEDERKTVWIEIGEELYTAGNGTFLNELVQIAGGENILADQEGWPQVSEEKVIELNPDVILITYASYVENAVEKVIARESWQDITAIKEGQVYALNSDITERPGPRITQGLKMIAEYLYPEKFAK